MRPPILTKYPVEQLVANLKDSKETSIWVTRFIPQILNKQKIHANTISLVKRVSLFKKQQRNSKTCNEVSPIFCIKGNC